MPRPKPLVRRFGQVDFDSMIALGTSDAADIFVTRRGAFGGNRTVTRAQINAGSAIPDPILLADGAVGAPSYSFTSDTDSGIFLPAADQLSLVAGGLDCINIAEVGGARQCGFYVTAPISLQTGVAVTDVAIHAALVALGLITA